MSRRTTNRQNGPCPASADRLLRSRKPLKIAMVIYPGCQHLDVAGPMEVFARSSRWIRDNVAGARDVYEVALVASSRGLVRTSSGIELNAVSSFDQLREVDTLLVAGGVGCRDAVADKALLDWLRSRDGSVRRIASICSGALILAAAGLLKGRDATTHFAYCEELRKIEPGCVVRSNAIFVQSGNVYTSAGVTTGIDLALALVEEDLGKAVAVQVAQELVVYRRRPGDQDQFSKFLEAEKRSDRIGSIQLWILDNLQQDLAVERLASAAHMSVRHFTRAFKAATGRSPATFVMEARLEEARRQLQLGIGSLKQVASSCGFQTEQNLRRTFQRTMGVSPADYRDQVGELVKTPVAATRQTH